MHLLSGLPDIHIGESPHPGARLSTLNVSVPPSTLCPAVRRLRSDPGFHQHELRVRRDRSRQKDRSGVQGHASTACITSRMSCPWHRPASRRAAAAHTGGSGRRATAGQGKRKPAARAVDGTVRRRAAVGPRHAGPVPRRPSTAALAEERAEIAAIAANPQPPTFENTIAAMQRAGQTRDRADAPLRRHDVEHAVAADTRPSIASGSRSSPPRATRSRSTNACSRGSTPCTRRCRRRRCAADQQRLTTLVYDSFVRRGAKLDAAGKAQLGNINQALAGLFSEFSAKVLADENTWTVLDRASRSRRAAGLARRRRDRAAAERGLAGKWAIVNTRSSVDPFLTLLDPPRPAREGVDAVQAARRQRRRERHERDHRTHREAARRARGPARLRDPRRTGGWPTRWPRIRRARGT